jgi:LuxR family transcriptional regulator, maltose regulon positive regulatory protein
MARLGRHAEALAMLEALEPELADSGEVASARAAIFLAAGDPETALTAAAEVRDGTVPAIGNNTVIEASLVAAFALRQLGDRNGVVTATEAALDLAEADRLVLPFAIAGARQLLEEMPRHQTAHAALLTDILEVLRGGQARARDQYPSPPAEQLSPSELRVLGYLPTNLSRPEIASELSVSVNTVNTHIRNIYAKLQAQDRSAAVRRARELRLLSARPNT